MNPELEQCRAYHRARVRARRRTKLLGILLPFVAALPGVVLFVLAGTAPAPLAPKAEASFVPVPLVQATVYGYPKPPAGTVQPPAQGYEREDLVDPFGNPYTVYTVLEGSTWFILDIWGIPFRYAELDAGDRILEDGTQILIEKGE